MYVCKNFYFYTRLKLFLFMTVTGYEFRTFCVHNKLVDFSMVENCIKNRKLNWTSRNVVLVSTNNTAYYFITIIF